MRRVLTSLILILCLGGLAPSDSGGEEVGLNEGSSGTTIKEELTQRVSDLYRALRLKDISTYYIRKSLEEFFVSPEELSDFIVSLLFDLRETGIKDQRIRKFKLKEVEFAKNNQEAKVRVRLSGRYFLFFNRSFTREDKWTYQDGKWLLIPPNKLY
jgi:hypothetical protein